jgi:CheY-like chemotaxis protein
VHRFWDTFLLPLARATDARVVCEIGSQHGRLTRRVLEHCLEVGGVTHVVDPAPQFDVAEWEERYGSALVVHRARSLEALPSLPPPDLALIDGDHNWYTVINELRLLERRAREGERPLPVVALHDVGWPYGRRDVYYDLATVPDDERLPAARQGP